jgi:hypothetical protein
MVIGNPCDDWNLKEELNDYMDIPPMAHRILVLAEGAIQEQGTHEQLISLGGRYAALFEMQAAGYR